MKDGVEDWDLWMRLVFAGCEVIPVFRIGAFYRLHPNSWSHQRLRMAKQYIRYHHRVLARARAYPNFVALLGRDPREFVLRVKWRLSQAISDLAFHYREDGRYWSAFVYYFTSLTWGNRASVASIFKLVPHACLRQIRAAMLATHDPAG